MHPVTRISGDLAQFAGVALLTRWILVGLALNGAGYALYLLITWLGVGPMLTVTIFYPIAITLAFVSHRKVTFRHDGPVLGAYARFFALYVSGYLLNIAILYLGVDMLGWAHQGVQAAAIFIVAIFLFVLSQTVVFNATPRPPAGSIASVESGRK